ncbi:hypothetical protein ANO11243_094970 [Dothideomycetidae sp. 11243]|nr:hypothetical protein ANO11243_094970 [fungal sp. No.11243]
MRLFPPPWEGLVSNNEGPPRLWCYPIHFAPAVGALFASPILLAGRLASATPAMAAGWTGAASLLLTCAAADFTVMHEKDVAQQLEEANVRLPARKFADRWNRLDGENVLMIGGVLGMLVASRRPAGWAKTRFWRTTRYVSAYSYGSLCAIPFTDSRSTVEYMAASVVDGDAADNRLWSRFGHAVHSHATQGYVPEHQSALELFHGQDSLKGNDTSPTIDALFEEWTKDPKPHFSYPITDENNNVTERGFAPRRNYLYLQEPDAESGLKEHMGTLLKRRERLSNEAEYLWRKGSQVHADLAAIADKRPSEHASENEMTEFEFEQAKVLATAHIVDDIHLKIWEEITTLDWVIADTKRQMLELEAKRKGSAWEPGRAKGKDTPLATARLLALNLYEEAWTIAQEVLPAVNAAMERREQIVRELSPEVVNDLSGSNPEREELDRIDSALFEANSVAHTFAALHRFLVEIGCSDLVRPLEPTFKLREDLLRESSGSEPRS